MALELYPRRSCLQHENHPENTPSLAKVGNLQVDELVRLSRSASHADLTRERKPHTRRLLTHLIGPPDVTTALDTSALEGFEPNSYGDDGVDWQRIIHRFGGWLKLIALPTNYPKLGRRRSPR